jgi:hypothetical protein
VRSTPLLILAYNRADKVRALIERLREYAPPIVMVVVDGPKPGNAKDEERVAAVRETVSAIDWTESVLTRFRPVNLGLRASVADAVTWAATEYGQVIVIEEDVLPGPNFLPYMTTMLDRYRGDERIMHVSGYNVVPADALSAPATASRLTEYPESIAWATWDRAWSHFDDDLTWGRSASLAELRAVTGNRFGARRWRQNLRDAAAGRISTWAYRWVASMWSVGGLSLSPNVNLVEYVGHDEGTNTLMRPAWTDLPVYTGPAEVLLTPTPERDRAADAWINRVVFRGTPFGVLRGVAITLALGIRQRRRARAAQAVAR